MLKIRYFPKTKIFYMENEIIQKNNLNEKIINLVKKKVN